MSYQINFTDSVNKGFIQVNDNTVNTETSLSLPGRTKSDYGAIINENLLHLLENFANNNPPANPVEGQLWYDTTVGIDQLKVYDGAQWVSASSIKKANSRPEAVESNLGDLWVDTANQQLFLYNGNDWTLVGPEFSLGSNTGARFEEIIDTTNVRQSVVTNFVKGVPVVIISDTEFTPKSTIQGFSIIKSGINLASGLKYYGTAETAENLIVPGEGNVLASNFARRDRDNTFARPVRIQNNGGVNIGETPTLQLAVSASNSIIRNLATNGDIRFRLTDDITGSNTVLTLRSNKLVGVNKDNPTEALDVVGNIKTSGDLISNGNLEVIGTTTLGNNLTVDGTIESKNITVWDINPDQLGRNIGTNNLRFNNVFAQIVNATTFTGSVFNGTFNGTLTGAAASLTSPTVFQLAGEVNSTNQITYGNSGNVGGTRTFNTVISPTFITNKQPTNIIDKNDEILIIRNNNGTDEIRKVTQEILVSTIPVIPVGMITPFGGNTPPAGWLLCDGSVLTTAAPYNSLHSVIGWQFDPNLTNGPTFRLPDMRGRFPLGNRAMVNLNNFSNPLDPNQPIPDLTTINDPESSQIGAKEGSAEKTIGIENLPEHRHTLIGDQGTEFYAITNIPNAPDSEVNSLAPNLSGTLQSSNISQTGDVANGIVGEDLDVVNPYQTVNYIIYAGVSN
jgi:microcystin-dependent protein